MAGGISLSQNARYLPQASGVAPTLTVIMVTTDINKPSIRMKSLTIANKKAHPQLSTKVMLYWPERLKPSAAPKTIIKILYQWIRLTNWDEKEHQGHVELGIVVSYFPIGLDLVVQLFMYFVFFGMHHQVCNE